MLNSTVLVLNRSYLPVHVTTARRAFSLIFSGHRAGGESRLRDLRLRGVERSSRPEAASRSARRAGALRVPRVIVLKHFDRVPRRHVRYSRLNIFARDKFTCQYCGRKPARSELNLDHVIPRSLGGRTTWENVVASCVDCNRRKGGRTPAQARLRLLRQPMRPRWTPLVHHAARAASLRGMAAVPARRRRCLGHRRAVGRENRTRARHALGPGTVRATGGSTVAGGRSGESPAAQGARASAAQTARSRARRRRQGRRRQDLRRREPRCDTGARRLPRRRGRRRPRGREPPHRARRAAPAPQPRRLRRGARGGRPQAARGDAHREPPAHRGDATQPRLAAAGPCAPRRVRARAAPARRGLRAARSRRRHRPRGDRLLHGRRRRHRGADSRSRPPSRTPTRFMRAAFYRRLRLAMLSRRSARGSSARRWTSATSAASARPWTCCARSSSSTRPRARASASAMRAFRPRMVVNEARSAEDIRLGFSVSSVCRSLLRDRGGVPRLREPHDDARRSLRALRPLVDAQPRWDAAVYLRASRASCWRSATARRRRRSIA